MVTWNQLKKYLQNNYDRMDKRDDYYYSKQFCEANKINFDKFKKFVENNGGFDDVEVLLNVIELYVDRNEDIKKTITRPVRNKAVMKGTMPRGGGLSFNWYNWTR